MAKLIRRRRPKDTIKKFETVAERKYQAGLELVDAGDNHTGVEQLAFAAEMWLKSAYFRFMRAHIGLARTTSEVTTQHLRDAANDAIRLGVIGNFAGAESFHSLLFWATLLSAQRKGWMRPLSAPVERDLLGRVKQLHRMWMVEHRYQPIEYRLSDVLEMRANVNWLRDNHTHLRR